MRLAHRTTRLLVSVLLISLPWLPPGAAAGVGTAADAAAPCLPMTAAAPPHHGCQPGDSATCVVHCAVEHAGVALLMVTAQPGHILSLAPHVSVQTLWPQRTTAPPLRPPRSRQI